MVQWSHVSAGPLPFNLALHKLQQGTDALLEKWQDPADLDAHLGLARSEPSLLGEIGR